MSTPGGRLDGRVPGSVARRALACSAALMSLATLPACGDLGPAPTVITVTPSAGYSNLPVPIVVNASMLRAGLVVDISGQDSYYDDSTIHMALVGDDPGLPGSVVDLGAIQPVAGVVGSAFLANVPAGLPPGSYGLRVTPANGHSVTAHAAFQELGLDLTPPTVIVDTPQMGATIGIGSDGTIYTANLRVDDGFGQLKAVNWSTSNGAMGSCLLMPEPSTNAPPGSSLCTPVFAIAPLAPVDGLGAPFSLSVDAFDVAGNETPVTVDVIVANLPKITSFDRTYGSLDGQQPITIQGAYFSLDAKAYLDVDAIVGYPPGNRMGGDVYSSGTIIGLTPRSALAHDVTVSVKTLAGVGDASNPFRYTAPPKLRLIQPASGPSSGGASLIIAGNDLLEGVTISFGTTYETSVPLYNAQYSSDDRVSGCLPPGQKGIVNVWASDAVTGVGEVVGGFTYTDDPAGDPGLVAPECQTAASP